MKNRREGIMCTIVLVVCIGILFYSLWGLKGKSYYFVSLAVIVSAILMFLARFENRMPSVAEITLLAVMCALAITSRIMFFSLPNIKPMVAMVIITGISLGAESGFMAGVISGFVSNFYFGQGTHTPFQMFALGVIGFFAGTMFRKIPVNKITLSIYGFLSVLILYGGIVDINTLYYMMGENTWQSICSVYGASFIFNVIHSVSTVCFLVLLHKPILNKLTRVKEKYHLIQ